MTTTSGPNRPMLTYLRIEGYGCIQDATFALTPLHALIGPNDSGKSTTLRALRTLSLLASPTVLGANSDGELLWSALIRGNRQKGPSTLSLGMGDIGWRVTSQGPREYLVGRTGGRDWRMVFAPQSEDQALLRPDSHGTILKGQDALKTAAAGSLLLRLDPDALRENSKLIPHGQSMRFMSERGHGIAGIYDALRERDMDAYVEVNRRFVDLFTSVKSLSLRNTSDSQKSMGVVLRDGTYVGASEMSEGMLYYLAFAALPYLDDPIAMLLIEEPENGLHPSRIAEVMGVLREVSKTTQVILATHSPLVINEMEGDEVSVVTRDPVSGTKATLLKDTPHYDTRSKIYANGELWLSYANGKDEAPLLGEPQEEAS